MRFLYLIQGKAAKVADYLALRGQGVRDLRGLTYDEPLAGFEYFPGSSFSQGRNRLYAIAKELIGDYDYFVFLDDDVAFVRGSFFQMEANLERFAPAIGIPLTEKTRRSAVGVEWRGRIHPLLRRQRFHLNDEQFLALSRQVVDDGLIFPMLERWDRDSWFVCCLIQEALIQHHYHDDSLQFNDCEISNCFHSGAYPHNLDYAQIESRRWLEEQLPRPRRRPADYPALFSLLRSPSGLARESLRSCRALVGRLIPKRP